jgi:hypothetical protein
MKKITTTLSLLLATIVSLMAAEPTVKVIAVIVPGATATEATLSTHGPTAALAVSGCNLMQKFGIAMSFQFLENGTPVQVSNFVIDSATYSVVRYRQSDSTAVTVLSNPFGSYISGGAARPLVLARNTSNVKVSGENVAIANTTLQGVSTFLMLEQEIPLNNGTRTRMAIVGDSYEFQWNIVGRYRYSNQDYSFPVTINSIKVKIQVVPNLPGFVPVTSAWSAIRLHASTDLTGWFPVPEISIPQPLPLGVTELLALSSGKTVTGISQVDRQKKFFLRWEQMPVVP